MLEYSKKSAYAHIEPTCSCIVPLLENYDLLSMLMEESDRQRTHRQCFSRSSSEKGKDEPDEALAASPAPKVKGKGKHAGFTCYNCDEKDHFCKKPRCPRPNKAANGKPTNAKLGSSAIVNAVESNVTCNEHDDA